MKTASFSRKGTARDSNEDRVLCMADRGLFLVCDGVASASGASQCVIDTVRRYFEDRDTRDRACPGVDSGSLESAFRAANQRLLERSVEGGNPLCAAAVAVLAEGDEFAVAWSGDCRCYRLSRKGAELLTRDHSRLNELADRGLLSEREAARKGRSAMTSCLGKKEQVTIDLAHGRLGAGECLLLCSDGVWGLLSGKDLAGLFSEAAEGGAEEFVARLEEHVAGGDDDAAAVALLNVGEEGRAKDVQPIDAETIDAILESAAAEISGDRLRGSAEGRRDGRTGAGKDPGAGLLAFLKSLPFRSRRELAVEAGIFCSALLGFMLLPSILELLGENLRWIGFGWWLMAALAVWLVVSWARHST